MARFGWVGFSLHSVPQIRQFCLFIHQDQNELHLKRWFVLPKSDSTGTLPSVVQAYTQPFPFAGRIKLIICQIRHEQSATVPEISNSWKETLDGTPYSYKIFKFTFPQGISSPHEVYYVGTRKICYGKVKRGSSVLWTLYLNLICVISDGKDLHI